MKRTNLFSRRCRGQRYALGDRGRPRSGSRPVVNVKVAYATHESPLPRAGEGSGVPGKVMTVRRDPHGARSDGDPACQNILALRVSRLAGAWTSG